MKKHFVVVFALMASTFVFGQKKELRKAEKALDGLNYSEALAQLNQAEAKFAEMDKDQVVEFYLIKTEALLGSGEQVSDNNLTNAVEALSQAKSRGLDKESQERADRIVGTLRGVFVNKAIEAQNDENYSKSAGFIYDAYKISPTDTIFLFNYASISTVAQNYDDAIEAYSKLLEMGFTGISTEYYAVNVANGEEERFNSIEDRKKSIDIGIHRDPRDQINESQRPEILKRLTSIYSVKGMFDKAQEIISEARSLNPSDPGLIMIEANMAYTMKDMKKYSSLIQEAIQLNPEDPILYYNLAIASYEIEDFEGAEKYYKESIRLDPSNTSAIINLGLLYIKDDSAILEQMNTLSMSRARADEKKYDELRDLRRENMKLALPYFEKVAEIDETNTNVLQTLKNIYSQLLMNEKYKAVKAKLDAIEENK